MDKPDQYAIVIGNAFDGLRFFGPFVSRENALGIAESLFRDEEWHIINLIAPQNIEVIDAVAT